MEPQLKQRIVGAAVLVALAVIFIPIYLDEGLLPETDLPPEEIPAPPDDAFNSRIVPLSAADLEDVEQAATAEVLPVGGEVAGDEGAAEPLDPDEARGAAVEAAVADPPDPASPSTTRTGVTAWVVQAGSFASEANAAALQERLRAGKYKAFVERTEEHADVAYRVRIGPELSRDTADEVRRKMEQELGVRGIIMRYP